MPDERTITITEVGVNNDFYRFNINNVANRLRGNPVGEQKLANFVEAIASAWCIAPEQVLSDITKAPFAMKGFTDGR